MLFVLRSLGRISSVPLPAPSVNSSSPELPSRTRKPPPQPNVWWLSAPPVLSLEKQHYSWLRGREGEHFHQRKTATGVTWTQPCEEAKRNRKKAVGVQLCSEPDCAGWDRAQQNRVPQIQPCHGRNQLLYHVHLELNYCHVSAFAEITHC